MRRLTKRGRRLTRVQAVRRGAVVSIIAVLASTAGARAANDRRQTYATALPTVVAAVDAARSGAPIPRSLKPPLATIRFQPKKYRLPFACSAHGSSPKTTSKVCHVGDTTSTQRLVLFGDSHAWMWLPAVTEMAWRDGWDVVPLIRFGCTPHKWFTHVGPDSCRGWFRWAIREIRQLHPAVTLLSGSIEELPSPVRDASVEGMIAAAKLLRPLGALVVIGDPEGLEFNAAQCVAARHASLSSCTTTWPASALSAYDEVARAVKGLGVGFLQTRGFVCYRRQCPAVIGHTIAWMDNSHLTGAYSAELAGPFAAAFLQARR